MTKPFVVPWTRFSPPKNYIVCDVSDKAVRDSGNITLEYTVIYCYYRLARCTTYSLPNVTITRSKDVMELGLCRDGNSFFRDRAGNLEAVSDSCDHSFGVF